MFQQPLRYAISNRNGSTKASFAAVSGQAAQLGQEGIEFFQLREKDLQAGLLANLARSVMEALRGSPTKLLMSGRADVAIAVGAGGVHLSSSVDALTPEQVCALYAQAGLPVPVITISCHALDEIARLQSSPVTAILFGPVYEKSVAGERVRAGIGLAQLHAACLAAGSIPVLALGGVTEETKIACLAAGAAGIAGIRLFERAHAPQATDQATSL